ncbi:unnamed protein product, partial [marine sediment metagenome]
PDVAKMHIEKKIDKGFLWMQELSDLLVEYMNQRDRYPTFESFFPRIVEFLNDYSEQEKR